jgi:GT2 family glycosyltransferase
MGPNKRSRVLHVITVYNGRAFVPRAIASAMRMDTSVADIDVLVLDDASPEPGWSAELEALCRHLGAHYYRPPRNLGIPRNVSLGMLTAVKKGYDYVVINNSDVIFPENLINVMVDACREENVGSVTAWSNNVSIYSLSNQEPDRFLAKQSVVDFVSKSLEKKFGSSVTDIPAGISFCIIMPVEVVKAVGLMDPVFGRGYCEETDWSLRSLQKGYRICLCPGVFVYHQGRGSNLAAGLVSGAHTTVPENEAIIDMRFPYFREQVAAFQEKKIVERYTRDAIDLLITAAAAEFGYTIAGGWGQFVEDAAPGVRVQILPRGFKPEVEYSFAGFQETRPLGRDNDMIEQIVSRLGREYLLRNDFDHSEFLSTIRNGKEEIQNPYPLATW